MSERREREWPPPQPDPDPERSHPGAFRDHHDDGFWERWLKGHHESKPLRDLIDRVLHRGADT